MKNYPDKQSGFALPVIIAAGVGVVVLLAIILWATGILKVSGTLTYNKNQTAATAPVESQTETTKTPTSTPVSTVPVLSETYTNQQQHYSLRYPKSWQVETQGKAVVIYSTDLEASSAAKSIAGVIINSGTLGKLKGSQFSTLTDLWKIELDKQFPSGTFGSDKDVKVGAYQAHVYELTYPQKNDQKFEARFFLVADMTNDKLYGLLGTAIKPLFTKYEATIQGIVNSFQML